MRSFREGLTEENEYFSENDPYYNGAIDTELWNRYGTDLAADCPEINSFLCFTWMTSQFHRKIGEMNEELYEMCHGDGYFTFQIV